MSKIRAVLFWVCIFLAMVLIGDILQHFAHRVSQLSDLIFGK